MDREALREAAKNRRSQGEKPAEERVSWHCGYCSKDFVFEKAFMNHRCPGKQRLDDVKSRLGQTAYAFYSSWMKAQRHTVPSIEAFAESRFFSTFVKFAKHVEKVRLPDPDSFIKLMVEHGRIAPSLWCRDTVFSMYLKLYDSAVPPRTQFIKSIELLEGMAVDHGVSLGDVFTVIPPSKLIELIERRKISHWQLMTSKKFISHLQSLPADERVPLTDAMNIGAFIDRMKQEPALAQEFSEGNRVMGL